MSAHTCGYEFARIIEVSTVPDGALHPIEQVILHAECPKCKAHIDLTVVLKKHDPVANRKAMLDS